ncbi:MAG: SH3 domain-containing protein [Desulfobulbaceae bacterium]|nr:SH3 domain-containing protein [Desulfobulbaceae bacterium]
MKSSIYLNVILFATLIFFTIFLSVFNATSLNAEMLSVKGDKVHLRSGPGTGFSIQWEYSSGFPVEVIERKGDWLKVKDFENDTGWMHKSLLINKPQTIVKANRNKDERINIRNAPGSGNKVIGMAYYGVVFRILRHQTGWVEVQHESGLKGWVSSNLLWGH